MSATACPSLGRMALNGAATPLARLYILLPLIFVFWLAFFRQEIPSFPPEGYSLKWFQAAAANNKPFVDGFLLSLQVGVASDPDRARARRCARQPGPDAPPHRARPALQHAAAAAAGDARHRARHLALRLPDRDRDRHRPAGDGLGKAASIAAHTLVVIPWVVRLVTASLAGFDRTIEEAAQNLGAGPWTTFRRVTLPSIRPGLVAGSGCSASSPPSAISR